MFRHGAIHNQAARDATPIPRLPRAIRRTIPNHFLKFPADADALANDRVGNCVTAARCQMIRLWGGTADEALAIRLYTAWGGYDPHTGTPDNGIDTLHAMFASVASPVVDSAGRQWPIRWAKAHHTDEDEIRAALARWPLEVTIGLPRQVAQEPGRWSEAPEPGWTADEPHRVVLGFEDGAGWWVRSWGLDVPIHPDLMRLMLLAVDVPIPVDGVEALALDGVDFGGLGIGTAPG